MLATDEKIALFEKLVVDPTIERMIGMPWQDFEDFVEYVFTCAGYAVKNVSKDKWPHGPGADLELYADRVDGKRVALVEVRRYTPPHNVDSDEAHVFSNKLNIEGLPGYLVTTSDFVAGAKAVAAAAALKGKLKLVDGARLLRFIAYIRGSRVKEPGPRRPTTPLPTPPDWLFEADAVERRSPTKTTYLAVGNNRGGVGKTTTAINIALGLAERNWRVLLVDMDPQSSMSRGLPDTTSTTNGSLLDYFLSGRTLVDLVRRTEFKYVSLLPAHPDMRMTDVGGGAHPAAELGFVSAMHDPTLVSPDKEKFDWVVFDTPPAQSFYTRAALAASHRLLIPATVDTWASLGINGVLDTAKAMNGLMGTGVQVVGCLVTRWRPGPVKAEWPQFEDDLRARNLSPLSIKIRHDDKIEHANLDTTKGKRTGIFHLGKKQSPGAEDYAQAVEELLRHVHGSTTAHTDTTGH